MSRWTMVHSKQWAQECSLWVIRGSRCGLVLLGLATFRLVHLITYDKILDFIRLAVMDGDGKPLKTATRGWRRLLCDVMGCIWCAGIWSALLLITIYLAGSWGHFAVLVLAVAGVGSLLQIISKAVAAQY